LSAGLLEEAELELTGLAADVEHGRTIAPAVMRVKSFSS
jgi:hypothetical protein